MLIITSIIHVRQSKFNTALIDEDSHKCILNCIHWQTLSELEMKPAVHENFLKDTKAVYSKMLVPSR
jgi:coatomer subunit beta